MFDWLRRWLAPDEQPDLRITREDDEVFMSRVQINPVESDIQSDISFRVGGCHMPEPIVTERYDCTPNREEVESPQSHVPASSDLAPGEYKYFAYIFGSGQRYEEIGLIDRNSYPKDYSDLANCLIVPIPARFNKIAAQRIKISKWYIPRSDHRSSIGKWWMKNRVKLTAEAKRVREEASAMVGIYRTEYDPYEQNSCGRQ